MILKKVNVFCLLSFFAFWLSIVSLTHAGVKEEEIPRGVNLSASYPYKEASKNKMHEKGILNVSGDKDKEAIDGETKARVLETLRNQRLSFIQNNGQVDEKVRFYERGHGHNISFTKRGIYVSVISGQDVGNCDKQPEGAKQDSATTPQAQEHQRPVQVSARKELQCETFRFTPLGANKDPQMIAEDRQKGRVNYFLGSDQTKWQTDVPTYDAVV